MGFGGLTMLRRALQHDGGLWQCGRWWRDDPPAVLGAGETLLLVVKDPANLGKGADWVWDVKGKYGVK